MKISALLCLLYSKFMNRTKLQLTFPLFCIGTAINIFVKRDRYFFLFIIQEQYPFHHISNFEHMDPQGWIKVEIRDAPKFWPNKQLSIIKQRSETFY